MPASGEQQQRSVWVFNGNGFASRVWQPGSSIMICEATISTFDEHFSAALRIA